MRQWTLRGGGGPESCHASEDVKRGRRPRAFPCVSGRKEGEGAQRVAMRQRTLRGGGGPESCHASVDVKRGRGPRELPCVRGR